MSLVARHTTRIAVRGRKIRRFVVCSDFTFVSKNSKAREGECVSVCASEPPVASVRNRCVNEHLSGCSLRKCCVLCVWETHTIDKQIRATQLEGPRSTRHSLRHTHRYRR